MHKVDYFCRTLHLEVVYPIYTTENEQKTEKPFTIYCNNDSMCSL